MTMTDDTTEFEQNEGVLPEGEAPPADEVGGQAEAEGETTEVEYLDVDANADRMVRIKVDGEEIEVPFKEALQGYQRQADYTRKTQELAAERQQVEQLRVLGQALERNPRETLAFLQRQYGVEGAQQIVDAAEGQASADRQEQQIDPAQQRFQELEQRISKFDEYLARQELDATLDGLKAKYGDDFDQNEVLAAAVERGVQHASQLEDVYRSVAFDRFMAQSQAQREAAEREAQERAARAAARDDAANTVSAGSGSVSDAAAAPPPATYSSFQEAYEAALRELS